jgi:hypothetical protein
MTSDNTSNLRRGTLVRSARYIAACDTVKDTLGVVFEETDAYKDGAGPMVRWTDGHACNVYEGDVIVVSA